MQGALIFAAVIAGARDNSRGGVTLLQGDSPPPPGKLASLLLVARSATDARVKAQCVRSREAMRSGLLSFAYDPSYLYIPFHTSGVTL